MEKATDKQKEYILKLLEKEMQELTKSIDLITKKEAGILIGFLEHDYLSDELKSILKKEIKFYKKEDFIRELKMTKPNLTERKINKIINDFIYYEKKLNPHKNNLLKYINNNGFSDYFMRWIVRNH